VPWKRKGVWNGLPLRFLVQAPKTSPTAGTLCEMGAKNYEKIIAIYLILIYNRKRNKI